MRKVATSIDINCNASKITDAFLKPDMLKEWWKVERCFIQPQSGGVYALLWNISAQGVGYVSSGIITLYQPGIMLTIEKLIYLNPEHPVLGPTTLTIEVQQNENNCTLHLTQSGYKEGADWDWYYDAVKAAWPQVLNTLKTYLERE